MRLHDSRRSSARPVTAALVVGGAGLSATMASAATEPVRAPVAAGTQSTPPPVTTTGTPSPGSIAVIVPAVGAVSAVGRRVLGRTRRRRR
ncbi:hypothetical protein [Gordonia sp. NB41Y]|uniref:hypothetical protein n=1 Tax=Gordonia sp. NB41Y TaxID=875808 RepID=UPI00273C350F|nr:hypothetical protein [Gordonia sp. NB41Y]WLP91823.1 hypothetical protein Q9K23_06135 [Gordonia sp. NB41Y]